MRSGQTPHTRPLVSLLLGFTTASLLIGASPSTTAARTNVDGFRAQVEKWTQTRQLISEERSEWDVEKESLRATRNLLSDEKKALEAELKELEANSTGADEERRTLLLQRAEYQRANAALQTRVRAMEEQVLAIAPLLPAPLQKKIELLLVQIPDDPETTKLQLGQRMMNILGVLAQAEKFNDTATFVGETRAVKGDQKVAVRTLYWGLAQAVYVDAQGETAGVGRPGRDGWVFSDQPELVDEAQGLLDIYEGNVDTIEFINFPVEIGGNQ